MGKCIFFIGMMLLASVWAEYPKGTISLETENFKIIQNAEVKEYFPSQYMGVPSGGKMLRMFRGIAEIETEIPFEMDYNIYLRFLKKGTVSYKIRIEQNGKKIDEQEFTDKSPSITEKDSSFVWCSFKALLPAGKIKLLLEKNDSNILDSDCIVLSQANSNYQPCINDFFAPLYVQVKSESEQPFYLHLWGRLPRKPWGIGHFNISKNGIFAGPIAGTNDISGVIQKDDSSPWVNIAPCLTEVGECRLQFYAMSKYPAPHKSASFTLYFSKTPSMDGLIDSVSRSGEGGGLRCIVDLSLKKLIKSLPESIEDLKRAQAVGEMPGNRPLKFPIGTGLAIDSSIDSNDIIENELNALSLIGLNMLRCDYGFSEKGLLEKHGFKYKFDGFSIYYLTKTPNCLSSFRDDFEKTLTARLLDMKNSKALDITKAFLLMDEPSFSLEHLMSCEHCKKGFAEFLIENNVSVSTPAAVTDKKENPELYYWTIRYRNSIQTEFFRKATEILHKTDPELGTGVNIANALFTNMMDDGCDWFELYESGALTYGWTEDWINQNTSFQLSGYMLDVMSAACRKKNITFGLYNILNRYPWEVEAKAFTELGHGVKSIEFFNYGPHYAVSGDIASHRDDIYAPIKSVSYTIGAVDDIIVSALPRRGDAAMLYSTVSDIWNMGNDNLRGRERALLHLLLRHAGIKIDVIYEKNLEKELSNYKTLFVSETNIRNSDSKIILAWVAQGGLLYLAPGALSFNEYNQPLNINFNINRNPIVVNVKGDYHPRRLNNAPLLGKVIYEGQNIPAIYAMQKLSGNDVLVKWSDNSPAVVMEKYGKGTVIAFGFMPGIAYAAGGVHNGIVAGPEKYFSCTSYAEAPRDMMKKLFSNTVKPHITTDNYLIEANVLENDGKKLIILANWSGKVQKTVITVNDSMLKVVSVKKGSNLKVETKNGKTIITLDVAAGDILTAEK